MILYTDSYKVMAFHVLSRFLLDRKRTCTNGGSYLIFGGEQISSILSLATTPERCSRLLAETGYPSFVPPPAYSQPSLKLHQPTATCGRNAIPIINPAPGITISSPPSSLSPAKMQESMGR
jgi:hypothetical protein